MLGLTARIADEWNSWGLPEGVRPGRMAVLDAACERHGNDPATIARSTQALVLLTDDTQATAAFVESVAPRDAMAGTPRRIAETVADYAEVGLDEFIVPDFVLGEGARKLEALDSLLEEFRALS